VPRNVVIRARPLGHPEAPWGTVTLHLAPSDLRIGWMKPEPETGGEPARSAASELHHGPITLKARETRRLVIQDRLGRSLERVRWSMLGPQGVSLLEPMGVHNVIRADRIPRRSTFHIYAKDPATGCEACLPVTVEAAPLPETRRLAAHHLPGDAFHPDWDLPGLRLLEPPTPLATMPGEAAPRSRDIQAVAYLDGDPGCWMLVENGRLFRMDAEGGRVPVPLTGSIDPQGASVLDPSQVTIEKLAARPAGSRPQVPELVVSLSLAVRDGSDPFLCTLTRAGVLAPLAGRSSAAFRKSGAPKPVRTGHSHEVDLAVPTGICLDRDGTVYLLSAVLPPNSGTASPDCVLRLGTDGQVTYLVPPAMEGGTPAAEDPDRLKSARELALDVERQCLYTASNGRRIFRIGLDGSVRPVTSPHASSRLVAPSTEGAWEEPGNRAFGRISSFSFEGGLLYFVDTIYGDLWALDPVRERLVCIATGAVAAPPTAGPLSLFAPDLVPQEQGHLSGPLALAVHGSTAVVGMRNCLGILDLGTGPLGPPFEAPHPPAAPRAGGEGKEGKGTRETKEEKGEAPAPSARILAPEGALVLHPNQDVTLQALDGERAGLEWIWRVDGPPGTTLKPLPDGGAILRTTATTGRIILWAHPKHEGWNEAVLSLDIRPEADPGGLD